MKTETQKPRAARVESHQYLRRVHVHGLGINKEGRPFALIEDDASKAVEVLYLDGAYHLTFLE